MCTLGIVIYCIVAPRQRSPVTSSALIRVCELNSRLPDALPGAQRSIARCISCVNYIFTVVQFTVSDIDICTFV